MKGLRAGRKDPCQAVCVDKDPSRSADVGRNLQYHLSGRFLVKIAFQSEVKGIAVPVHENPKTIRHIRLSEFVLVTIIGMTPGIAAATIFESQLEVAIRNPVVDTLLTLAAIAVFLLVAIMIIKSRLLARQEGKG